MTDNVFDELIPFAERFIECAHLRDRGGMDHVLADVQHFLNVYPADALATVLAEMYFVDRERLDFLEEEFKKVSDERDKFARNYLDQKNRVQELREVLDNRAGKMPTGKARKVAA